MNTTRKGGPGSTKPQPLSPDDSRLLAFQPGEMSAETREAIAAHRARYVAAREQRRGDKPPVEGAPVTVTDSDGFVVIRPIHDARFTEAQCSGMMPLMDSEPQS